MVTAPLMARRAVTPPAVSFIGVMLGRVREAPGRPISGEPIPDKGPWRAQGSGRPMPATAKLPASMTVPPP